MTPLGFVTEVECTCQQLKAVPCSLVLLDEGGRKRSEEEAGAAELGVLVSRKLSGLDEEGFRTHMNCFRKGESVLTLTPTCPLTLRLPFASRRVTLPVISGW